MAQIGTVRLETQNSGVVDVPVFEPGDSASGIYEFVRVETASGPGFIPVTDPVDATYPYLRVQSQNNGIVAVTDTPGSDIPDSAFPQDLVAWYRFEDGDARDYTTDLGVGDTTAYDGTLNGVSYQSNGGVTDFENGPNSGAFDFGGSDNISLPTLPPHNTVCVWVEEDSQGEFGTIIQTEGISIQSRDFDNNYNLDGNITGDPSSNIGQYTHLAVSAGASDGDGYINGVNVGSTGTGASTSSGVAKIGSQINDDSQTFINGRVDDVRIYGRQFSDSEIADIYNATMP